MIAKIEEQQQVSAMMEKTARTVVSYGSSLS